MKRVHAPANDNNTEQWTFDDPDGSMNHQSYVAWFGGISMAEADRLMRGTGERQYGLPLFNLQGGNIFD